MVKDLIDELFEQFSADDLLEDRREYMPIDLQLAYGLSEKDAQRLYDKIQRCFQAGE